MIVYPVEQGIVLALFVTYICTILNILPHAMSMEDFSSLCVIDRQWRGGGGAGRWCPLSMCLSVWSWSSPSNWSLGMMRRLWSLTSPAQSDCTVVSESCWLVDIVEFYNGIHWCFSPGLDVSKSTPHHHVCQMYFECDLFSSVVFFMFHWNLLHALLQTPCASTDTTAGMRQCTV